MTDQDFMSRAIELAEKGRGKTSPNPFVGAVIVKSGKIVGEGYTQKAGGNHAEIQAIKKAGAQTRGSTLYVTLEPCCHEGRTGPCTEAIIKAGIKEVVIGIKDPNPLVAGKGTKALKKAKIRVKTGLLNKIIEQQNEDFFTFITTKSPFICIKSALSLDGKLSVPGKRIKLTSKESDVYVHILRSEHDAIMVGTHTVLVDNPELTVRHVQGRNPTRVILDAGLKIPLNAKVFRNNAPVIIATSKQSSTRKKASFAKKKHITVLELPVDRQNHISLKKLFKELGKMEITSVLVEGGGILNGSLLKQKLVDKMILIHTPHILGDEAVNMVERFKGKVELLDTCSAEIGTDTWTEGYLV